MSVQKLYNPEAYRPALLVVHDSQVPCCPKDNQKFCKNKVELTTLMGINSITITDANGDKVVPVTVEGVATPRNVRKALAKALESAGYDPYYKDSWKGITVEDKTICIVGNVTVSSIGIGGVNKPLVKSCTMGRICKIKGLIAYNTNAGILSSTLTGTGTQIGMTNGFPAGQTGTVQTALEAALSAEGIDFVSVEVTELIKHGTYAYTICTQGKPNVFLDKCLLEYCECMPDFIFTPETVVDSNDDFGVFIGCLADEVFSGKSSSPGKPAKGDKVELCLNGEVQGVFTIETAIDNTNGTCSFSFIEDTASVEADSLKPLENNTNGGETNPGLEQA